MKVLGIHGSPRKNGNSALLLERCLEGAAAGGAEVQTIKAAGMKISGCLECGGCDETGQCVVDDEMQQVYPLIVNARRIVIAAPIFFYGFPSQLKALIDRAQALWSRRRLTKTVAQRKSHDSGRGYLIAVGATRGENLFEGCDLVARYFYDAADMDYRGGLFFRRVDKKGAIGEVPGALDQAYELGMRLAQDKDGL
ncbi:MAG TPA: flavodoxin family protein [Myxococcota bacterium]|nr:flavodoxin family protein [Myxococcota bacterium]